jgi:hypothetical protein
MASYYDIIRNLKKVNTLAAAKKLAADALTKTSLLRSESTTEGLKNIVNDAVEPKAAAVSSGVTL